jgi:hypothetical protein
MACEGFIMMPYIVRQGDTVASIVARRAVGVDPNSVWTHPTNKALHDRRSDPSILSPGDVLYLPDAARDWRSLHVGTTNAFTAIVVTQPVSIVLGGEEPLANEPYLARILGLDVRGTTGPDGSLAIDVPIHCNSFVLELLNRGTAHTVLVGHLDPHTEPSGVRQRLSNLGYGSLIALHLPALGIDQVSCDRLHLLSFQLAQGLPATGDLDPATSDALNKAHGT